MRNSFNVGDKVVCIEDQWVYGANLEPPIPKNRLYTVSKVIESEDMLDTDLIALEEFSLPGVLFNASAFKIVLPLQTAEQPSTEVHTGITTNFLIEDLELLYKLRDQVSALSKEVIRLKALLDAQERPTIEKRLSPTTSVTINGQTYIKDPSGALIAELIPVRKRNS